jgi:hypothetical protein
VKRGSTQKRRNAEVSAETAKIASTSDPVWVFETVNRSKIHAHPNGEVTYVITNRRSGGGVRHCRALSNHRQGAMTMSINRAVAALAAICALTACQDSPAGPNSAPDLKGPSFVITPDPTLATFNSASCSLTSSATGAISCSWNISNPNETHLITSAEALLTASYDCVNPKNGRVASSQDRPLRTADQYPVDSATSLTGSNVAVAPPLLPTDYTGKMKKQNACSDHQLVQGLSWSLDYWQISVVTVMGTTARMNCFASDNRNGCQTL